MAIANSIKKGEQYLEKDQYEEAIAEFQNALKESSTSFKALIGKSIAHQRLKQFDESLQDSQKALASAKDRNNRENIGLAYLRLAIIYFNKSEIGKSLKSVNLAKEFNANDPSFNIWYTKITKKAMKDGIFEENIDELSNSLTSSKLSETDTTKTVPAKASQAAAAPAPDTKTPKFSYYQSNEKITVDFFYKNVTNPVIEFKPTSLSIEFKTTAGSDVIFDFKLFAPIIPEQSSFKVMSTKVEVTLAKKQPGKWSSLEGSGQDLETATIKTATTSSSTPLAYPTSSKNKTNWSNFQVDDDKEEEEEDDENAFFRKLYAGADDDTKRAMMKSFVESNGTALSTNWSDTKEKKWDVTPPEGVEAKKW